MFLFFESKMLIKFLYKKLFFSWVNVLKQKMRGVIDKYNFK